MVNSLIGNPTNIAGFPLSSDAPLFLAFIAVHVAAGLTSVIAGAIAMLSRKRPGRHPQAGTVYYCSCGRLRHDVRPRVLQMERGLSPVHFGASVVCRRDDRSDGEAKTLAVLAAYSRDRNARVLYPDDYSFLCGQWAKPAAVAGIASAGVLDSADAHRRANPHQCAASSSACEANGPAQSIASVPAKYNTAREAFSGGEADLADFVFLASA